MSQFGFESPGSVKNQVGRSLIVIRNAVEREDTLAVANHTRLLVALSSPYILEADRPKLELPADTGDDDKLFEACMRIVETLLGILAANGIYAYSPPQTTSAADLAVRDEE